MKTEQHKLLESTAPSTEECWKVIERVAESSNLKRAFRLKEFLFYVGRRSIKELSSEIHEQEIGRMVFGRKESYDTSHDNIVRVSATELRKRVDAYFATEGEHEPLIFEIPRGSYTPVFRTRTVEAAPQETSESHPPISAHQEKEDAQAGGLSVLPVVSAKLSYYHLYAVAGLLAVSVGLLVACALLWRQNRRMLKVVHAWEGSLRWQLFGPGSSIPISRRISSSRTPRFRSFRR